MGRSRITHAGRALTEKQDRFVRLIAHGVSNGEACRLVGINRRTGTRWRLGRTIANTAGEAVHYPPVHIAAPRTRHPRYLSLDERMLIAAIPTHTGPVDLLSAFAFPLPITVICEILGIPATDRDQFRAWTNTILFAGTDSRETVLTAAANMNAYLRDLITDRRAHPGDDMLSGLASATDTGGSLTDTEVVSMTFLLLVAGHETTVNLIGNTMLTLLQDRKRLTELRAHPDQIPAAVEEHLRHLGPVHIATLRFTTEPVNLGDTTIGPDELVFVSLAAANRDPHRFARPELVDYDRDNPGHLAFGHGIHVCLGAPAGPRRRRHRPHSPARPLPAHEPRHRPRHPAVADQQSHPRPGRPARATALTRHRGQGERREMIVAASDEDHVDALGGGAHLVRYPRQA